MSVNGIEIKVGQVWKTRNGVDVTITATDGVSRYRNRTYPIEGGSLCGCKALSWLRDGRNIVDGSPDYDLVTLLNDADEETPDPVPQAVETAAPGAFFPDISETDRATGKVNLSPHYRVERVEISHTAPDLLDAAANHMRDRAATYDKPEGERSMLQTVAIFNQFHGTALTEAQGWHLMQILKDVRMFANPEQPHRDSVEDCVAYAALKGEAFLKGGAQ